MLRPDGGRLFFNLDSGGWNPESDVALTLQELTLGSMRIGWKFSLTDALVEIYDPLGKLQSIITRDGVTETMAYATDGALQRVTDPLGRSLVFPHDQGTGLLASVTKPGGAQFVFDFTSDASDNAYLKHANYLDPSSTHPVREYEYGEGANAQAYQLTDIVDENTARYATWQYDSAGRTWLSVHGSASDTTDRVELTYTGDLTTSTAATTRPGNPAHRCFRHVLAAHHQYDVERHVSCHGSTQRTELQQHRPRIADEMDLQFARPNALPLQCGSYRQWGNCWCRQLPLRRLRAPHHDHQERCKPCAGLYPGGSAGV